MRCLTVEEKNVTIEGYTTIPEEIKEKVIQMDKNEFLSFFTGLEKNQKMEMWSYLIFGSKTKPKFAESIEISPKTGNIFEVKIDGMPIIEITAKMNTPKLIISPEKKYKKKKRVKKPKKREHASMPTSLLTDEIIDQHESKNINASEKKVVSGTIKNKAGTIKFSEEIKEQINPFTPESEILKNYKNLGFTREELQVYLATLNVYLHNMPKTKYGHPFELETPYFHNEILNRKNRLRKEDLKRYELIFERLASKRIHYTTNNASTAPYKRKNMSNVNINSPLIHADIITDTKYKHQIIRIVPSAYTLLELKQIKQISNYLPWDLLQLSFDKSCDNIFYFGAYLVRMHRNNENRQVGKKRVKNVTCAWEVELKTIVENALPNGKELIDRYKNEREKKKFIQRNIEKPLKEALKILEKHKYIIPIKKKRIDINYRDAFSENKIKVIFNYDNGKLLKIEKDKEE
jgi:hypothetical protein